MFLIERIESVMGGKRSYGDRTRNIYGVGRMEGRW